MSARFASASTQKLLNAAPLVVAVPFSLGFWCRPTTTGALKGIWYLGDTASANNYWRLVQTSVNTWQINANAGGANANTTAGTVTADKWTYIVIRCISATNRRLHVLHFDGSPAHAQNTASRAPAGVDAMAFGCNNTNTPDVFWDGQLGEYWLADADIQKDGAQLQDSTLRQLAMQGPFSVPHIAKDIIEYRSFRSRGLDSRSDDPEEVYHRGVRQVWTNANGVKLGPHPPAAERFNGHGPLPYTAPMVLV